MNKKGNNTLRNIILLVIGVLVYAYGVHITKIDLEEPLKEKRIEVTTNVLRKLARPNIFEWNEERTSTNITVTIPCADDTGDATFEVDGRTVVLSPGCSSSNQSVLTITGTGFRPNTRGIIRWYAPSEQTTEGIRRQLGSIKTDRDGSFVSEVKMADIRPTDDPQRIEIEEITETWFPLPKWSETSKLTFNKIVETVMLALIASTVGTILAIPISFMAARNLMAQVNSPLAAIGSGIIAVPIGAVLSFQVSKYFVDAAATVAASSTGTAILALVVSTALLVAVVWYSLSKVTAEEKESSMQDYIITAVEVIAIIALFFYVTGLLGSLGTILGSSIKSSWGSMAFLGSFLKVISDFLRLIVPAMFGLIGALLAGSWGSTFGQELVLRNDDKIGRIVTVIASALGSFILVYGIGSGLDWLRDFTNREMFTLYPGLVAAALAVGTSLYIHPRKPIETGMAAYTIIRLVLNTLRSIEPLVMVIVFAVWVGIGPFAGILALTLHSVAALGKLFSEQVESIAEGPLEAITTTGATRLQTIVFAVIPQIIPPYIAFTFYRWDINVRMSTIIGFAGGGGIGFVLNQEINLLNYSNASVMMISIAVVVATLDYLSSRIRSRII